MAYFCLAEDTPGDALAEKTVMTIPGMGQRQWKNMSGTFPSFLYSSCISGTATDTTPSTEEHQARVPPLWWRTRAAFAVRGFCHLERRRVPQQPGDILILCLWRPEGRLGTH